MDLKMIFHYEEDDRSCSRDYLCVDVVSGEEVVVRYGDAYHARGREKAIGFIHGVKYATGRDVNVTIEHKSDGVSL